MRCDELARIGSFWWFRFGHNNEPRDELSRQESFRSDDHFPARTWVDRWVQAFGLLLEYSHGKDLWPVHCCLLLSDQYVDLNSVKVTTPLLYNRLLSKFLQESLVDFQLSFCHGSTISLATLLSFFNLVLESMFEEEISLFNFVF